MFLFQKIWFARSSCNARFEIRLFALLPTKYRGVASIFCILYLNIAWFLVEDMFDILFCRHKYLVLRETLV